MQPEERGRLWKVRRDELDFPHEFLASRELRLANKSYIHNRQVVSKIRDFSADVLVVPDNSSNIVSSLLVQHYGSRMGIPVVLWSESFPWYALGHSMSLRVATRVLSLMKNYLYRTADAIFSLSRTQRNFLISTLGVEAEKIFYSPQCYPADLIRPYYREPQLKRRHENNIILFVGYLRRVPDKGVCVLLESFAQVLPHVPDSKLVIIGDGESRGSLQAKARDLPVKFTGNLEGQEKYDWFEKSKLLVLPSFQEAWGLVVNEALYWSLPVIVTRQSVVSEIVANGENGFIVEAGDARQLASRIESLLHLPFDRYAEMARRAKASVFGLDIESMLKVFTAAIAKARAKRRGHA